MITGYQEGRGRWEKDFKICMVMMVSAEALQSDLVQIFPNFHDFWQSYCHKYSSPTRKQKPWENCGPNHIKSFITCLGGLQSLFKSSHGR